MEKEALKILGSTPPLSSSSAAGRMTSWAKLVAPVPAPDKVSSTDKAQPPSGTIQDAATGTATKTTPSMERGAKGSNSSIGGASASKGGAARPPSAAKTSTQQPQGYVHIYPFAEFSILFLENVRTQMRAHESHSTQLDMHRKPLQTPTAQNEHGVTLPAAPVPVANGASALAKSTGLSFGSFAQASTAGGVSTSSNAPSPTSQAAAATTAAPQSAKPAALSINASSPVCSSLLNSFNSHFFLSVCPRCAARFLTSR